MRGGQRPCGDACHAVDGNDKGGGDQRDTSAALAVDAQPQLSQ